MLFHHHFSKTQNMAIPQTFHDFSVQKMNRDFLKSTKRPFINMTGKDRAVEITHLFPNRDQEVLCGDRKIMYLVNIPQLWFSLTRPHLSMFTCRSSSLWAPGTDTDSYFSLVRFKTLPRCSFHCKHRWAVITALVDLRQCLRQDSGITITWNELRHFGWFSENDCIIF